MPVRIDRRASSPALTALTATALGAVVALLTAPALAQPAPTPPDGATDAPPPEKPAQPVDAPRPPPTAEPPKVEPTKVTPVEAVKPLPPPEAPKPPPPQSGFAFGSYGRMIAGTDFKGAPGRDADVVAHGSRLDESNYVELELRRDDYWQKTDSTTRLVATLAVANPIFHYNGDFNVKMAIRNLYIEERDLGIKDLSVWAGSRMYRGDDIYLLDFWPLDNLNTMGAGARYDIAKTTFVALHAGFNEPNTPFYLQQVDRPSPLNQLGATGVNVLDRQRFIGSAKISHIIPVGQGGIKGVLYAEAHQLSAGQRETQPRVFETLPSDGGYVIGAQIGAYTGERAGHVNLFLRYAHGLAAYGEFATPSQLGADSTTAGAHELLLALGGNWEAGPFGLMAGAYLRSFRNASPGLDFGDVDEGIFAIRPNIFFGEIGGIAVEGSYQAQQRGVVTQADPAAGQPASTSGPFSASLWRLGIMPFISPAGRGDYSRPQFRLIYVLTARNKGAQALYPVDDVFSLRSTEHFFGLGAEWWFNSSSYSR
jgi:LamB porin